MNNKRPMTKRELWAELRQTGLIVFGVITIVLAYGLEAGQVSMFWFILSATCFFVTVFSAIVIEQ